MVRQSIAAALAAVLTGVMAHAQFRRPKADVTPIADADGIRSGTSARFALTVSLPEGLHVQSNKPRDPSLIPTALTVTPPAGITVAEIVYPPATDFTLSGSSQPLAVFGEHFTIGVRLAVAASVAPGDIVVPARLRYQACDTSSCFPPASELTLWPLRVVGADAAVSPQHAGVFAAIHFSPFSGDPNGR